MEVLQMWAARDRIGLDFYKYKPFKCEDGLWVSDTKYNVLNDWDEPDTFPFIKEDADEPTELHAAVGTFHEVMLGWLEFVCAQYSGRTIDNIVDNLRARVEWEKEHPLSIDDLNFEIKSSAKRPE